MPEENPPQIGCPYRATPSDIKTVNGQPNQKICDRKRDRYTDRPKGQAYQERKNDGTRVDRLCSQQVPAATLTDKQPAGSIGKRDAKRRNCESSKNDSCLLPLWSQQYQR